MGVPSLAQKATCSHQAASDAPLKQFGDHPHVDPGTPVAALAGQHEEAGRLGVGQFELQPLGGQPAPGFLDESLGQVVVHQHRGSGDQDRVEPVGFRVGQQHPKGGDRPARLFVQKVSDLRRHGRGFLVVGHPHGPYAVAQDGLLGLEDRQQGLCLRA